MYTGYFAKLKEYEKAGLIPVSIAGKAPAWYHGLEYKKLAPKWSFFNEWKNGSHKGDNDYYIKEFNEQVLKQCDINAVLRDLMKLTGTSDLSKIILLCYEKPDDFCHRHLVAKWISEIGQVISWCFVADVVEYSKQQKIILNDEDIQKLKDLGYDC